jgi:hypothetical protein
LEQPSRDAGEPEGIVTAHPDFRESLERDAHDLLHRGT